MTAFWRGPCLLFYLWPWSRFPSVHSWVQFLPTAEFSPGLPCAAWQLLVGRQCPGTQLRGTQYRFCIFCVIISLIINIINIICKTFYIQFVGLSPFSSFSLPLVGGWALTESIGHSVYCCPAFNLQQYLILSFWRNKVNIVHYVNEGLEKKAQNYLGELSVLRLAKVLGKAHVVYSFFSTVLG